jgi:hypothetical protein
VKTLFAVSSVRDLLAIFSLASSTTTMASSSGDVPRLTKEGRPDCGGGTMGMFDHVVVLDETLSCPHGHRVEGFQTKSFAEAAMDTYLLDGSHVFLVSRNSLGGSEDDETGHWSLEGSEAVYQRRHAVETVVPPGEVFFYTSCDGCAPVLVRCDHPRIWGDLIEERQLWVEFRATFDAEGRHIERTSGTRDDLMTELRENGLRVMRDDEPLAVAHREIRSARDAMPSRRGRSGR